jgi:hypothetical protein
MIEVLYQDRGLPVTTKETEHLIKLPRPHPQKEVKRYQLDEIEEQLKIKGFIE